MKTLPPVIFDREVPRRKRSNGFFSLLLIACHGAVGVLSAQGLTDAVPNGVSPFRPQVALHVTRANSEPSVVPQATARALGPAEAPKLSYFAPTRSSFMAAWEKVEGATGYRLDVSTDSSFTEYVAGYQNVDVGNTLGQVVFGLKPGTTYYYRVRSYNSNSPGPDSPVTSAITSIAPGLVINPTFDASILNDPDSGSIQSVIYDAIAKYQASFTDPITVSILFRYANTQPGGTPIASGTLGGTSLVNYRIAWTTFINALKADAKTSNDASANASLPASPLSTNILLSSANGRAIGLNTPGVMSSDGSVSLGGTFDGIVTLNSDQTFAFFRPPSANFDALTVVQHQIDEVLGLGSFLNFGGTDLQPEDLFSWSAASVRSTKTTGNRYFSIDKGLTKIVGFSQDRSADLGAWLSTSCPQSTPYVQNAFICAGEFAEYDDISRCTPEGIALDVIGYDLVVPSTYSPQTDCNIVEWLKADDLALFYLDGSFVPDWFAAVGSDLVPSFFDILPWAPPTFKLNGLNGLPIVRTDGLSQWLNSFTFSPALPQPNQIFMVFRTSTTTDGYFFSGNSLVNLQVISVANGNWDFLSATLDQHMGPVNTNWNVVFVEVNGASSRYRFNNGVNGAFVKMSGNPGNDAFSNLMIGAGINANGYPGGFTATDYAEIIVRRGLTDPSTVMNYLNTKWNVYSTASPTPTPTPGPTPTVSISASPASVAHRGSSTITVKRSAASNQAISVSYITGGTAILGSGYTLSGTPGKVIIPASQTSATITLQSVNTAPHAHNQNANIRLTVGAGYKLGSPSNVTVTLLAY